MSDISQFVEPTQVLLPGQAIVSLVSYKRPIVLGNVIYSGVFLRDTREGKQVRYISDDFGLFDFAFYLASEKSIKELVNSQASVKKDDYVVSGFPDSTFSVLCNTFQSHKDALQSGIYAVTLRGGRIENFEK